METGITQWTVDPNLDANETEMMSKFTGYDREMRHYSQKEKREIRDPAFVKKVSQVFTRSPVPFSLYFWQSTNPNYDRTSFKGMVDQQWMMKYLGESATHSIMKQTSHDSITVVLTNNLSDENKVSLTTPWIVAHRIAHAMLGDNDTEQSNRIQMLMKNFLRKIMTVGYQCEWPDNDTEYGRIISNDYHEIYGQLMGHTLGTMKSAREGKITSVYEWWHETVTQFIITGKITFKPLPEKFDTFNLTSNAAMRKVVLKAWATLPLKIEGSVTKLLNESRGAVFLV